MIHGTPHALFLLLVALMAAQRLLELAKSRKHERALMLQGGIEVAAGHFSWMRAIHAGWLIAMAVESTLFGELPRTTSLITFGMLFMLGQSLRLGAMETLGSRWTARVYCVPNEDLVTRGLYRYVSHPNYLGVVIEIAAVPMLFGCWRTALVFSVLNALILAIRIPSETGALRMYAAREETEHA